MTDKEKQKLMEEAVEWAYPVFSFNEAMNVLETARREKANIYVEMSSGKKLYALVDDEDSCYQKVFGCTKAELEERKRKAEEEEIERELEDLKKVPARVERGLKIIDQNQESWEKDVVACTKDMYRGADIDHALDVMEVIKQGDFEKAHQMLLASGHSNNSWDRIAYIITKFLKEGNKFYDFVDGKEDADEND